MINDQHIVFRDLNLRIYIKKAEPEPLSPKPLSQNLNLRIYILSVWPHGTFFCRRCFPNTKKMPPFLCRSAGLRGPCTLAPPRSGSCLAFLCPLWGRVWFSCVSFAFLLFFSIGSRGNQWSGICFCSAIRHFSSHRRWIQLLRIWIW